MNKLAQVELAGGALALVGFGVLIYKIYNAVPSTDDVSKAAKEAIDAVNKAVEDYQLPGETSAIKSDAKHIIVDEQRYPIRWDAATQRYVRTGDPQLPELDDEWEPGLLEVIYDKITGKEPKEFKADEW